jgi:hypothetical protein
LIAGSAPLAIVMCHAVCVGAIPSLSLSLSLSLSPLPLPLP